MRFRSVLCAGLAALACLTFHVRSRAEPPELKVVSIAAERFRYDPARVVLKKGERVVLELTSRDVTMGFALPALGLRADMIPGQTVRLEFVPNASGTYLFFCDVFCGSGHEEMTGVIEVVD